MKINHQTRKSTAVFVILGVLMIPFQNCGKFEVPSANTPGSSTQSSTSTGGGSGGTGGSGTGTNPPSPAPNPSPNPGPDVEQQRKDRCMALQSTPTIAFSSAAAVSINSGMGATSGDTSATQAVTVDHKVSNLSAFTADACSSAINITSDIVQDATHIISVTSGVDMSGVLLGSAQITDKQAFGRASAQSMSGASAYVVSSATSNVTFNVTNMRQNTYNRCVSGTFPVRYRAEVKTYTQTLTSAPVWGTITLNNTCWTQSKLRGLNESLESSRLAGLGTAVAVDGVWAVAVATNELNGPITGTGAAYIYKSNGNGGWDFTEEIRISDAARGDNLSAVALHGDILVLTSRYRGGQGAAFVFKRSGNVWGSAYETLVPPVSQTDQGFGTSVSFDGTTLAIGAADYSSVAGNYDASGTVYVYTYNGTNFTYSKQIQIPNSINQAVGSSVSVSGNLVAIGAPQAVTKESLDIGHVYVYNLSNSTYATVNSGIAANGAKFGTSVSLLGNQLAVGAPGHSNSKGAAFYYPNYSGANKSYILGGSDGDQQGTSTILVSAGLYTGAPYEGFRGVSRAGAITFSAMSVITSVNGQVGMSAANVFKLGSYETSSNSAFGWAIGVSGNNIIAGARIKSDPQNGSGAAYMFLKQ